MSGDPDEVVEEILVTAYRTARSEPQPMLVEASGGGDNDDFWGTVMRGLDTATQQTGIAYDRLMESLANQIADDDGDGVMNFQDELKGWNDGVFKSRSDNGQILAEVRPGYWKVFDSGGNATSNFFRVTDVAFTDAGAGFTIGASPGGATFSFVSGDSTKFNLVIVDPPAGM